MLLENISIGRTIEIYIDREGYLYRMTSTVEETNSKRLCVTLIAANGRAFAFRPEDKVKIVYKDSEQMWEWDNVKAGIGKLGETAVHYFDITNLGTSFNRRGAYRVSLGADAMIGYYDKFDSDMKSSDIPELSEEDREKVSSSELQPKFVNPVIGGTGRNTLPGQRFTISCRIPLSVATINSVASSFSANDRMAAVEPTKSASASTALLHSGCANTFAAGCAAFSSTIFSMENCSCTWQPPFHNSISRPVTAFR